MSCDTSYSTEGLALPNQCSLSCHCISVTDCSYWYTYFTCYQCLFPVTDSSKPDFLTLLQKIRNTFIEVGLDEEKKDTNEWYEIRRKLIPHMEAVQEVDITLLCSPSYWHWVFQTCPEQWLSWNIIIHLYKFCSTSRLGYKLLAIVYPAALKMSILKYWHGCIKNRNTDNNIVFHSMGTTEFKRLLSYTVSERPEYNGWSLLCCSVVHTRLPMQPTTTEKILK